MPNDGCQSRGDATYCQPSKRPLANFAELAVSTDLTRRFERSNLPGICSEARIDQLLEDKAQQAGSLLGQKRAGVLQADLSRRGLMNIVRVDRTRVDLFENGKSPTSEKLGDRDCSPARRISLRLGHFL